MARGVDNIDPVIFKLGVHSFPKAGSGGGGNGDTPLLFLLHPIHCGRAIVHLTNFVGHACIEQYPLCGGGFAGIYVCTDTNVAIATDGGFASHNIFLILEAKKGGY